MVLQVPWSWIDLLWIVAVLDSSVTSFATRSHVRCNLNNQVGGSCSCWEVRMTETPWPPHDTPAAPAPRNATLEMDYYDGKMFPEIGWTVDRKHAGDVDGFYVELHFLPNYYMYYRCSHNVSTILKNVAVGPITYKFDGCCKSLYNGFQMGDELYVTIFSLPLYGVNDEPNYTRTSLLVEGDEMPGNEVDDQDDDPMNHLNEWQESNKDLKSIAEEKSTSSNRNPKYQLLESDQELNLLKKND